MVRIGFRQMLVASVFLLGSVVQAQEARDPSESDLLIVANAWSDAAKCNRNNAIHLTIAEVTRGDVWNGSCVAISGYWRGSVLFERKQDAENDEATFGSDFEEKRIGLYGRDKLIQTAPKNAIYYQMVGVLSRCETQWPWDVMVTGYCHYTDGPILLLSQAFPKKDVR